MLALEAIIPSLFAGGGLIISIIVVVVVKPELLWNHELKHYRVICVIEF